MFQCHLYLWRAVLSAAGIVTDDRPVRFISFYNNKKHKLQNQFDCHKCQFSRLLDLDLSSQRSDNSEAEEIEVFVLLPLPPIAFHPPKKLWFHFLWRPAWGTSCDDFVKTVPQFLRIRFEGWCKRELHSVTSAMSLCPRCFQLKLLLNQLNNVGKHKIFGNIKICNCLTIDCVSHSGALERSQEGVC